MHSSSLQKLKRVTQQDNESIAKATHRLKMAETLVCFHTFLNQQTLLEIRTMSFCTTEHSVCIIWKQLLGVCTNT